MSRAAKYLGLAVGMLMVLGACGDSDSGSSSDASTAKVATPVAPEDPGLDGQYSTADMGDSAADGALEVSVGNLDDAAVGGGVMPEGREIIRTANLHIRTDNISKAVAEATALAARHGGFVAAQSVDLEIDPFATITIRLPAGDFEALLADLGDLGALLSQNVTSQDVTGEYVDLQSRITSAEVSVERLRGFLAKAETVADIASLEGQLAGRESNLEAMKGQLRALADRVALTTVTVTLTSPESPELIEPQDNDTSLAGFQDGLDAGIAGLLVIATLLSSLAGVSLPFLPIAAVGGGAYVLRKRRQSQ